MSTLRFQPIQGKTEEIVEAILATPEVKACPKEAFAVHLVSEEIAANITQYAYAPGAEAEGYVVIDVTLGGDTLTITFTDGGVAFNPLERDMPDVTLPLEERPIGGLGIFLTKQMMDSVSYARENNENVLTVTKHIDHEK